MVNKMQQCIRDNYLEILNKCIEFDIHLSNHDLKIIKNTLRFLYFSGGKQKVLKFKDEFIKRITNEEE